MPEFCARARPESRVTPCGPRNKESFAHGVFYLWDCCTNVVVCYGFAGDGRSQDGVCRIRVLFGVPRLRGSKEPFAPGGGTPNRKSIRTCNGPGGGLSSIDSQPPNGEHIPAGAGMAIGRLPDKDEDRYELRGDPSWVAGKRNGPNNRWLSPFSPSFA